MGKLDTYFIKKFAERVNKVFCKRNLEILLCLYLTNKPLYTCEISNLLGGREVSYYLKQLEKAGLVFRVRRMHPSLRVPATYNYLTERGVEVVRFLRQKFSVEVNLIEER